MDNTDNLQPFDPSEDDDGNIIPVQMVVVPISNSNEMVLVYNLTSKDLGPFSLD
jgi:hypothetical protein